MILICLLVIMGRGSFTGIRIGLATVKAFCDVYDKPCVPVSSLEALAFSCSDDGVVCSLIDAKHENVYVGIFARVSNGWKFYPQFEPYSQMDFK